MLLNYCRIFKQLGGILKRFQEIDLNKTFGNFLNMIRCIKIKFPKTAKRMGA